MLGTIEKLLERHNTERRGAINLIVSENRMSERAVAPLSSDIQSRYAASFYAGTGPAQEIIFTVTDLAKQVFGAEFANLSPISGNMALLAVIFVLDEKPGLCWPRSTIFSGWWISSQLRNFRQEAITPGVFGINLATGSSEDT